MPDSNPRPLPQKSGALPMSHHIYKEFCLVINLEKYSFHINEIEFLPFWATLCQQSACGPLHLSSNAKAVQQFPESATVKDMQVFLGNSSPMPPACCCLSLTAYVGDCHPTQCCLGHI